jgi:hypothetical protein
MTCPFFDPLFEDLPYRTGWVLAGNWVRSRPSRKGGHLPQRVFVLQGSSTRLVASHNRLPSGCTGRGKGGPKAHPVGTQSALPATGAAGTLPGGKQRLLSSGLVPMAALGPHPVRRTSS